MEHLTPPQRMPGVRLQARDLAILTELGEVSLLDTETIHQRHFADDASGQACRRRLRLLTAHGLTQSLQIAVTSTNRPGRLPTIHRLTAAGAEVVAQETGRRSLRTARSDPPRPNTLLHRLGMARVVLAVNDACRLHRLSQPDWLLEYDTVPQAPRQASFAERFVICHEFVVEKGTKATCWPDAASLLSIPKQSKNWELGILWEFDRSTESLTQVTEKLIGYQVFLERQAYRPYWPTVSGVRIFFVVPSDARRKNILTAIAKHPSAGAVRIATADDAWNSNRVLSEPIWITATNEQRKILD